MNTWMLWTSFARAGPFLWRNILSNNGAKISRAQRQPTDNLGLEAYR